MYCTLLLFTPLLCVYSTLLICGCSTVRVCVNSSLLVCACMSLRGILKELLPLVLTCDAAWRGP